MLLAWLSAASLLRQDPVPDLIVVAPDPVVLIDNYDEAFSSNCAGYSLSTGCYQTLVGIYYPTGSGPATLGYSGPPRPVLIQLRGGNSNNDSPTQLGWFQTYVLPHGFVGVDPNYAPVLPGQDYTVSLADVGLLVQYLRHYHAWFNIDPERIFVFGRSFGGIMALAVGLRDDAQNLAASNPLLHESSRPNFLIPFSAMADMNCLAPQVLWGDLLTLWFPVSSAPGATKAQKDADSPVWWLLHPELYSRAWTPRICFGYPPPTGLSCGQYLDPHDGGFGPMMLAKLDELVVQSNQADLGIAAKLIQSAGDQYAFGATMAEAMGWATAQLVPPSADFYLVPPKTPITPLGSQQQLRVVGAQPSAILGFFAGTQSGAVSVPGCANIQTGLLDFFALGWKFADAQGQAQLSVFAPPQAIGYDWTLHVGDFLHCEVSQLLHKKWTE